MPVPYNITQNPLNNNEWSFPLMECIHIAMFALSIGTIAVVDFRLLGLLFKERSLQNIRFTRWLCRASPGYQRYSPR
jgi:hypothetical protein